MAYFLKVQCAILSSNIFFNGPTIGVGIYFTFNICSFKCRASTFLLMCKSRIWLLTCFNTPSFCLSSTHFLCLHLIFISLYHILSLHIFHDISVVISLMIWVSIYYVAHVKMNTLQPMISFEILL